MKKNKYVRNHVKLVGLRIDSICFCAFWTKIDINMPTVFSIAMDFIPRNSAAPEFQKINHCALRRIEYYIFSSVISPTIAMASISTLAPLGNAAA